MSNGCVVLPSLTKQVRETLVAKIEIGPKRKTVLIVTASFFAPAFFHQNIGQVAFGFCVLRIERQRPFVVCCGTIPVLEVVPGQTKVKLSLSQRRISLDRKFIFADCLVYPSGLVQSLAVVQLSLRILRQDLRHFLGALNCGHHPTDQLRAAKYPEGNNQRGPSEGMPKPSRQRPARRRRGESRTINSKHDT